jgi:hypothetical protein
MTDHLERPDYTQYVKPVEPEPEPEDDMMDKVIDLFEGERE